MVNHTGFRKDLNISGIYLFYELLYLTQYNGYPLPHYLTDYYYNLIKYIGWKCEDIMRTGFRLNLKIGK